MFRIRVHRSDSSNSGITWNDWGKKLKEKISGQKSLGMAAFRKEKKNPMKQTVVVLKICIVKKSIKLVPWPGA